MVNGSTTVIKEHPCGIVCTRPEYYTLPSLEELPQYLDDNGTCIVKGFTIGRKGYGNVYFPDEMDISGLNIDDLVHFRYREINVYPDDTKKPPVGQVSKKFIIKIWLIMHLYSLHLLCNKNCNLEKSYHKIFSEHFQIWFKTEINKFVDVFKKVTLILSLCESILLKKIFTFTLDIMRCLYASKVSSVD